MLECDFELNGKKDVDIGLDSPSYNFDDYEPESLYSVKWYKDNEEFYRFVPKSNPPQNSYKVEGIKVDVSIIFIRKILDTFHPSSKDSAADSKLFKASAITHSTKCYLCIIYLVLPLKILTKRTQKEDTS